jgi:tape measure domain-containing protein
MMTVDALRMADGLNVPIGRLRQLAEQGQLTADVVVRALMS